MASTEKAPRDERTQTVQRVNGDDTMYDEALRLTYRDEFYTGETVELNDDGVIVELQNWLNGYEHGAQREYYANGRLKAEYQAVHGLPVGMSYRWHPNGRMARHEQFDKWGNLRLREVWDENGVPDPNEYANSW